MKKRYKWLLAIALLIFSPYLVSGVNRFISLFYTMSYKNLGEDISSAHFKLEKIYLPGRPGYREAKSSVIDSQHTDTLKLLANGEVDQDSDLEPFVFNFSVVPERFRKRINASFLMIWRRSVFLIIYFLSLRSPDEKFKEHAILQIKKIIMGKWINCTSGELQQ